MDDPSKKSDGQPRGAYSGQVQVTEIEEPRGTEGVDDSLSSCPPSAQLSVAGYPVDLGIELPSDLLSMVQEWLSAYVKIAQKRLPEGTLEEQLRLSVVLLALKRYEDRSTLSKKKAYISKLEKEFFALKENFETELAAKVRLVEEKYVGVLDNAISIVDAAREAISDAATDLPVLEEEGESDALTTSRISRDLLNLDEHDSSET